MAESNLLIKSGKMKVISMTSLVMKLFLLKNKQTIDLLISRLELEESTCLSLSSSMLSKYQIELITITTVSLSHQAN
jgi:hypothetical protein